PRSSGNSGHAVDEALVEGVDASAEHAGRRAPDVGQRVDDLTLAGHAGEDEARALPVVEAKREGSEDRVGDTHPLGALGPARAGVAEDFRISGSRRPVIRPAEDATQPTHEG